MRDDDDRFSLWAIPGPKRLVHDGRRLLLTTKLGRRFVHLALSAGLSDGCPFAFAVPRAPAARTHAGEIADVLAGVPDRRGTETRISRSMLVHMRALHALDAAEAGASEREVAACVLGGDADPAWSDSAARAQVRYLLRHGRRFRDGDHRRLLRAAPETASA